LAFCYLIEATEMKQRQQKLPQLVKRKEPRL